MLRVTKNKLRAHATIMVFSKRSPSIVVDGANPCSSDLCGLAAYGVDLAKS